MGAGARFGGRGCAGEEAVDGRREVGRVRMRRRREAEREEAKVVGLRRKDRRVRLVHVVHVHLRVGVTVTAVAAGMSRREVVKGAGRQEGVRGHWPLACCRHCGRGRGEAMNRVVVVVMLMLTRDCSC